MRIIYYQEKLHLSLTKSEIDDLYHAKGRAVEVCPSCLLTLQQDISEATRQYLIDLQNKLDKHENSE